MHTTKEWKRCDVCIAHLPLFITYFHFENANCWFKDQHSMFHLVSPFSIIQCVVFMSNISKRIFSKIYIFFHMFGVYYFISNSYETPFRWDNTIYCFLFLTFAFYIVSHWMEQEKNVKVNKINAFTFSYFHFASIKPCNENLLNPNHLRMSIL